MGRPAGRGSPGPSSARLRADPPAWRADRSASRGLASPAHDGLVQMDASCRAQERRVAEGEYPAVRGHQPVAGPGSGAGHPHDGLVEMDGTGRPEERTVAEG